MELLNQMDGFDQTANVKVRVPWWWWCWWWCDVVWCLPCVQVIMATNRQDTLDPALLRPGRLDRKIEFPLPDRRQKRMVFQVKRLGGIALGSDSLLTGAHL